MNAYQLLLVLRDARDEGRWLEQAEIVKQLVDCHLAATACGESVFEARRNAWQSSFTPDALNRSDNGALRVVLAIHGTLKHFRQRQRMIERAMAAQGLPVTYVRMGGVDVPVRVDPTMPRDMVMMISRST